MDITLSFRFTRKTVTSALVTCSGVMLVLAIGTAFVEIDPIMASVMAVPMILGTAFGKLQPTLTRNGDKGE